MQVLWCGPADAALAGELHAEGATITDVRDVACPPERTLDGPHLFSQLQTSDHVCAALQALHEQHRFDSIFLPGHDGLAFRTIQAKQTGQAFHDVALHVVSPGPHDVRGRRPHRWPTAPEDLAIEYMEQYSLERADAQQAPAKSSPGPVENPLVTLSIAYHNLPQFLDDALGSVARQDYPNLEVLVINDGSTQVEANRVFDELRGKYASFRFITQENRGIGATRNRGLAEARGMYFLPMDADNVARPDMIRRLVQGMQRQSNLAALSCYFLAFREPADLAQARFAYAYKPLGGPFVLGCLRNVYGDGNALFRTEALRSVGGFETDRHTSFEDWEVFVKLVKAGLRVDVAPEFLFYYRHRDAGFSRTTDAFVNHQRVLRHYVDLESLPASDRSALWNLLVGCHLRNLELEDQNRSLQTILASRRYRFVDVVGRALRRVLRVAP